MYACVCGNMISIYHYKYEVGRARVSTKSIHVIIPNEEELTGTSGHAMPLLLQVMPLSLSLGLYQPV